jgi:hypothetical protein
MRAVDGSRWLVAERVGLDRAICGAGRWCRAPGHVQPVWSRLGRASSRIEAGTARGGIVREDKQDSTTDQLGAVGRENLGGLLLQCSADRRRILAATLLRERCEPRTLAYSELPFERLPVLHDKGVRLVMRRARRYCPCPARGEQRCCAHQTAANGALPSRAVHTFSPCSPNLHDSSGAKSPMK